MKLVISTAHWIGAKLGHVDASNVHHDILAFSELLPGGGRCKYKSGLISQTFAYSRTCFAAALNNKHMTQMFIISLRFIKNTSDHLEASTVCMWSHLLCLEKEVFQGFETLKFGTEAEISEMDILNPL